MEYEKKILNVFLNVSSANQFIIEQNNVEVNIQKTAVAILKSFCFQKIYMSAIKPSL